MSKTRTTEVLTASSSITQLERVAAQHEATAASLHKLAKALKGVLSYVERLPDKPKRKRKGMSKAQREAISKSAKARWAAKKAQAKARGKLKGIGYDPEATVA